MTDGQRIDLEARDEAARRLYELDRLCPICHGEITLADELFGRCPKCGAIVLAGPDITSDVARRMLATLKVRRRELGLSE